MLNGLILVAITDTFQGAQQLGSLARTAGESKTNAEKFMGKPKEMLTLEEYNKRCPIPNDSWEPDPQPQTDIDEVWYYEISPNRIAYLYFKNGVVVRIYHGAT